MEQEDKSVIAFKATRKKCALSDGASQWFTLAEYLKWREDHPYQATRRRGSKVRHRQNMKLFEENDND